MADRVVILSDLHLGAGKRCVEDPLALRPLWQDADHLVLNGDTGELHHIELRARAAREVIRLIDALDDDGVPVTILAGNHDPYVTDLRHLHLAGGQVFVTHGDAFHPSISPWCAYAKRLRDNHDTAIRSLPAVKRHDLTARLDAIRFASHLEWLTEKQHRTRFMEMLFRPRNVFKLFHYWWQVPALADRFVDRYSPDARFVVFGHSHRQGIWQVGRRIAINTGAFGFPGRPRGIVLEHGELSVWDVVRKRGEYRFAARPRRRFSLRQDVPLIADDHAVPAYNSNELLIAS